MLQNSKTHIVTKLKTKNGTKPNSVSCDKTQKNNLGPNLKTKMIAKLKVYQSSNCYSPQIVTKPKVWPKSKSFFFFIKPTNSNGDKTQSVTDQKTQTVFFYF